MLTGFRLKRPEKPKGEIKVRKKAERRKLPGHTCKDCEKVNYCESFASNSTSHHLSRLPFYYSYKSPVLSNVTTSFSVLRLARLESGRTTEANQSRQSSSIEYRTSEDAGALLEPRFAEYARNGGKR